MIFNKDLIKEILQYPRPDQRRIHEIIDSGWEFKFIHSEKEVKTSSRWRPVKVPFPIESKASGINERFKGESMVYRTRFNLPQWARDGNIRLNLGAIDYYSRIAIDGKTIGEHRGGYTPWYIDLHHLSDSASHQIEIYVEDPLSRAQLRGKQTFIKRNIFVHYTPISGIWQDVWIEPLCFPHIEQWRFFPSINGGSLEIRLRGEASKIKIHLEGKEISAQLFSGAHGKDQMSMWTAEIEPNKLAPWSPDDPQLHPISIMTFDEKGNMGDKIDSQIGLRYVERRGGRLFLNGSPLYQRLVLNQGYYPEGHYRPIDKIGYLHDCELIKEAGFNGMRIHQKIEDPALLFCLDTIGLLAWEEMPSSLSLTNKGRNNFCKELYEVISRDFNHPSIIAWVPFNESWGMYDMLFKRSRRNELRHWTALIHELDPTRLVVDNSGFHHLGGDILDQHHYLPARDASKGLYKRLVSRQFNSFSLIKFILIFSKWGEVFPQPILMDKDTIDCGQPLMISEYGGFGFYKSKEDSKQKLQELISAYTADIRAEKSIIGFCYTQFTDVEQEKNGLFTFDRKPKFSIREMAKIFKA
ncbi:MAG: hypothetical protein J7L53_01995 [Deltaproteobacteria bacterium]|nr:hypothetical protein [Deltaproteobacteria bacterium]